MNQSSLLGSIISKPYTPTMRGFSLMGFNLSSSSSSSNKDKDLKRKEHIIKEINIMDLQHLRKDK